MLLFQCGAFFEVYGVKDCSIDPHNTIESFAKCCNLSIATKKHFWDTEQKYPILMAGFKDYFLDKYVEKIVEHGHTVVVYQQEDATDTATREKKRSILGVFSPGTYLNELSTQTSNNVMSIVGHVQRRLHNHEKFVCGISTINAITGQSYFFEYDAPYTVPVMFDELISCIECYQPSEVLFTCDNTTNDMTQHVANLFSSRVLFHVIRDVDKMQNSQKQTYQEHLINRQWGDDIYAMTNEFSQYPLATQSLCLLLDFVGNHNKDSLKNMAFPVFHNSNHRLVLANHTLKQLNIIDDDKSSRDDGHGAVLSLLNQCVTAMGKRRFKETLLHPTRQIEWLNREYSMIHHFSSPPERDSMVLPLRKIMSSIQDFEKMARQCILRRFSPASVLSLYRSMEYTQQIHECLREDTIVLEYLSDDKPVRQLDTWFSEFSVFVRRHIDLNKIEEDKNCLQPENYPELAALQAEQETCMKTLYGLVDWFNTTVSSHAGKRRCSNDEDTTAYVRLHKTEKYGYSLQITKIRAQILRDILKKRSDKAPGDHENVMNTIAWQDETILISSLTFHKGSDSWETIECPWLKSLNCKIQQLDASLETHFHNFYHAFLSKIEIEWLSLIQFAAHFIGKLDVLLCKVYTSKKYHYCRPSISARTSTRSHVEAKGMRHALIEHLLKQEVYVPNDVCLDSNNKRGLLLYGINSAGKTSLLKSLGICIVLAQSGNYVPCKYFCYYPYSAIFSRIVGTDNLFRGLSSFAVEMSELRVILNTANANSLVLADEISRGSEIDSAMSITASTIEYLHRKEACYFITSHLHEIVKMDEIASLREAGHLQISHLKVMYDASLDTLVYDRQLQDSSGESFYGLLVCRSLHLPPDFIDRAYFFREKYIQTGGSLTAPISHYNAQKIRGMCEICGVEISSETHHLTPQHLFVNHANPPLPIHKHHVANLAAVCSQCHDAIHRDNATLERKKTLKGYKFITKI